MFLAQSATRNVGLVILAIVLIGFLVYLLFNLLESRDEVGSEIELAANRKPYHDDDILETTMLDRSLMSALVLLAIIGLALPLYWLGEPGRQEGYVDNTLELWTEDGAEAYEESCSSCHGGGGAGGIAPYALTAQGSGEFVASVDWVAPSLTSVLSRFSEDEVRHILNYGRNGVMPAWGAPGGGPLTEQQIDVIIVYLRSVQKDSDAVQAAVQDGLIEEGRLELAGQESPQLVTQLEDAKRALASATQTGLSSQIDPAQAQVSAANRALGNAYPTETVAAWVAEISDPDHAEYLTYGKLLFVNRADSGAYGCARCHTSGWSYDGANDRDIQGNPVTQLSDGSPGYVQGGGWFGPNITAGSEITQFPNFDSHVDFIRKGSVDGERYGIAGQGSGQMPGFSTRTDDDIIEKVDEDGVTVERAKTWPASLTEDQIQAVVAYARSL